MRTCERCGEQNTERARFCQGCGAALAARPDAGEERKIVSVLFVDLIGFTQRADGADPEDVRAFLRPYFALLKQEIEGFGGVVEKFIGDAVLAAFGAPIAHEDDPERAVRAALRVTEAIAEANESMPGVELKTRAAINTGEVLVAYGHQPGGGLGLLAGDIVNTAARLQEVAPPGGVVVAEATYAATKDVIVYDQMEPVSVKGKTLPLAVWRAVAPRSQIAAELRHRPSTPLVGRDHEITLLKSCYLRAIRDPCAQIVTLIGEPGVGKTRLVMELAGYVDEQPELVAWRQGRCLPYGRGITFWALGEIVRAQLGVLETDSEDEVAAKLDQALAATAEDASERHWLRAALGPLVGAPSEQGRGLERDESFTAWRRYLESIATGRPLVLVFEDLHWADEALLAFIEHLIEWSSEVPLLLICTARPELYEKKPGWGGGQKNSTTVSLSPLSDDETSRLLSTLLVSNVLPLMVERDLLKRAGGIPLYAEQFIQMLIDRGLLVPREGSGEVEAAWEVEIPDSLKALIAARLDTLSAELKSVLHDAAVIGKSFWSGSLATMQSLDQRTIVERLHQLSAREFVRPLKTSTFRGQLEYTFRHVLIRDVAYGQIPRSSRSRKHWAAARWLESVAESRAADHAELLADHYTRALELARASGADGDSMRLIEQGARRFLVLAAERAAQLDAASAMDHYRRALELLPEGHPDRARVLVGTGETSSDAAAPLVESQHYFERAIAEAEATGNTQVLGRAIAGLAHNLDLHGDTARASALFDRAIEVLEKDPSEELMFAYVQRAGRAMLAGRPHDTLYWADKALKGISSADLPDDLAVVLNYRGSARCELGDLDGLDDIRESVRMTQNASVRHRPVSMTNLADWLWFIQGPGHALAVLDEVVDVCRRFGLRRSELWAEGEKLWMLFELGRWDEVLDRGKRVLANTQRGTQLWAVVVPYEARVLIGRGDVSNASLLVDEFLPRARAIGDLQISVPALVVAALVRQAQGEPGEAVRLVDELAEVTSDAPIYRVQELAEATRIAAVIDLGVAKKLLEGLDHPAARAQAAIASARGAIDLAAGSFETASARFEEAASCWQGQGNVVEEAQALLGWARSAARQGEQERAEGLLASAGALFEKLGASQAVNSTATG